MKFLNNKIFFFDFDGTISNRDSFILFSLFSIRIGSFIKFWTETLFFIFKMPKGKIKERFFENFRGIDLLSFELISNEFVEVKLKNIIKWTFLEYLKKIPKGSRIVIVSASISNYLKPWCDEMGFDLISTELEVIDGKLTGKFSTPNCNGKEKVRRIKEKYNLKEFNEIHVFGNSKGDLPMLELGTHKYYKFFK
ncbi:haloacid dehalogenase-like hydrolase [Flavobacteriaceae bacterium]|nr:haloacid dehalogenase-like hydrolase [Flavobacteriaceae bacterium]